MSSFFRHHVGSGLRPMLLKVKFKNAGETPLARRTAAMLRRRLQIGDSYINDAAIVAVGSEPAAFYLFGMDVALNQFFCSHLGGAQEVLRQGAVVANASGSAAARICTGSMPSVSTGRIFS